MSVEGNFYAPRPARSGYDPIIMPPPARDRALPPAAQLHAGARPESGAGVCGTSRTAWRDPEDAAGDAADGVDAALAKFDAALDDGLNVRRNGGGLWAVRDVSPLLAEEGQRCGSRPRAGIHADAERCQRSSSTRRVGSEDRGVYGWREAKPARRARRARANPRRNCWRGDRDRGRAGPRWQAVGRQRSRLAARGRLEALVGRNLVCPQQAGTY